MAEYIEREALIDAVESIDWYSVYKGKLTAGAPNTENALYKANSIYAAIDNAPAVDVAQVRHGRWILEAHDERVNYRWNVTAECSECCDEQKEIWAGFFPNVPDWLARDTALIDAKSVKLSNYCPNCGAKMDGGDGNSDIA